MLCGDVVAYDDLSCERCDPEIIPRDGNGVADQTLCVFRYEGGVRNAIIRLKRERDERCAVFFAVSIMDRFCAAFSDVQIDRLLPVPGRRDKTKLRGYDHAQLIAQYCGRISGIECADGLLARAEQSRDQHELSARERLQNARESYALTANADDIKGKRLLLVDDVHTTGATTQICRELLLAAGAAEVYVATVARTMEKAHIETTEKTAID